MRRHAHKGRGVATITAVLLTGYLALALAMTASLLAQELRRTNQQRTHAQLRQLLLAGAALAQERLADDPASRTQDLAPTLPAALVEAGARLTVALRPGDAPDHCLATVVAGLGPQDAEERLVLARESGVWMTLDAQIVQQKAHAARAPSGK
jgi:type II secretory pathway component PulK